MFGIRIINNRGRGKQQVRWKESVNEGELDISNCGKPAKPRRKWRGIA